MENIQFIQITPEQLKENIVNAVKDQLDSLKKDFQPKNPEEFLTREEVAKLLKVNISTIGNWKKAGVLKPHFLGSRVYFKRSEIEDSLITID